MNGKMNGIKLLKGLRTLNALIFDIIYILGLKLNIWCSILIENVFFGVRPRTCLQINLWSEPEIRIMISEKVYGSIFYFILMFFLQKWSTFDTLVSRVDACCRRFFALTTCSDRPGHNWMNDDGVICFLVKNNQILTGN